MVGTPEQIAATAPIASRLTKTALARGHRDVDACLDWEALAQPIARATGALAGDTRAQLAALIGPIVQPRELLRCLLLKLCGIEFKYSIVDSGTGRELQNQPIHNIAGLGGQLH